MGNLCGKSSSYVADTTPGHRLGSGTQQQKPTSSIPLHHSNPKPANKQKITGPGRTLGGRGSGSSPTTTSEPASRSINPREAAARAAEARENEAKTKSNKGILSARLDTQKRIPNQQLQQESKSVTTSDALAWN